MEILRVIDGRLHILGGGDDEVQRWDQLPLDRIASAVNAMFTDRYGGPSLTVHGACNLTDPDCPEERRMECVRAAAGIIPGAHP